MTDEREGTAQDFARLLGGPEPQPAGPDAEQRRAIAQRHGLAPEMGDRLRGETPAELEADAAAVAALTQRPEPTELPTIKERAQRNLREQLGIGADEAKHDRNRAIIELLHPSNGGDE